MSPRPANPPTKTAKPPSRLSLRISQIPSSVQRDEFSSLLQDLSPGKEENVLGWTFCPDATTCYESLYNVATIEVREAPQWLSKFGNGLWETKYGTFVADSDFLGLTPLSNPSRSDTIVDIIVVHGLGGHAFESWNARTDHSMWLRDFLLEMVPNARIMLYGYDTKLECSNSFSSIIDLAKDLLLALNTVREHSMLTKRSLIFIGHCLGGLVIKKALVEASRSRTDDHNIFNSTYGLLFFGVPSRGLEIESLLALVDDQPNKALIEYLGPNSAFLAHHHNEFFRDFSFTDARIVSIFETRTTASMQFQGGSWKSVGTEIVMVPQSSAIHHSKHDQVYDILSIDANHGDIVRFPNRFDPGYKAVQSRIREMVESAPDAVRKRTRGKDSEESCELPAYEMPEVKTWEVGLQGMEPRELLQKLAEARSRHGSLMEVARGRS